MSLGAVVFDRRGGVPSGAGAYALPSSRVEEMLPEVWERLGPSVLLSTCARVELYAARDPEHLAGPFSDIVHEQIGSRLEPSAFVTLDDVATPRHLFRVAAGLESAIVGESEVLGQVRRAFLLAASTGELDPALPRLFHAAVRTGRRVRVETGVSRGSVSLASTALALAAHTLGSLEGRTVLVIGAGEIGTAAARHAHAIGARVILVNRSLEHATSLASEIGIVARPLNELEDALAVSDCVVSCTGAPQEIVGHDAVARAAGGRSERLAMVDLAAPHDIDPRAAQVPGVFLYDLRTVEQYANEASRLREGEIAAAERVVEQECARFLAWYRGAPITPTIAALQRRGDEVRQRAVMMTLSRLPHLGDGDRKRIEIMASAIVSQLLSTPIARLKNADDPGGYATVLSELFALNAAAEGVG